jgi:phosphoserine phosphatase
MSTFFCFDLDGTMTRREILPAIASEVGLSEEIALLTSLTMRGLVPFESSFRLRCRILRESMTTY